MQGTVVLGTGEPSPIMKRSPSARLDKREAFANGEKLFQSFDGNQPRTRRNSIPSPFGIRNETGRGSVPLLLGVPGHRPNSGTTRSSFSRSLKSFMRGLGDQSGSTGGNGAGGSDLSKLDDKLATIKHQLDDMSIETRNFGARVSNLVQDISMLTQTIPSLLQSAFDNETLPRTSSSKAAARDKTLTLPQDMPQRAETSSSSSTKPLYHTLPLVLPMIRAHSQPLTHHLMEANWRTDLKSMTVGEREELGCEGDESGGEELPSDGVSQDSQEDFEVKVIHSSLLDNHHHMIVVSSPISSSPCPPIDFHSGSSEESLHDIYKDGSKHEGGHQDASNEFPLPLDMEGVVNI